MAPSSHTSKEKVIAHSQNPNSLKPSMLLSKLKEEYHYKVMAFALVQL